MTTDRPAAMIDNSTPPCQMNGKIHRKFRKLCCCVTFILLLNTLTLLHLCHSVGVLSWFLSVGSYTFHDTTYMFIPGGSKTLCNDLCVDMCIYGSSSVQCRLESCLDSCNRRMIQSGNENEAFQTVLKESHPIVDDAYPAYLMDDYVVYEAMPSSTVSVEDVVFEPQDELNAMQARIEAAADRLRATKATYAQQCGKDGGYANKLRSVRCKMSKQGIRASIAAFKESIARYNSFAVSIHVEISVQVW
eukprot:CAMPEP_0202685626 /NCGR_PEP_ID=MMETSP1385-20130828/1436_1 /ASSEMBLY_ACC=CAM_ASM_000861 /TAXON_ID=933848 /ORGANISM="Elphidium margaritaceum" /LENGTH=246 /DNA_ID=CAMNT_0049340035 /DNA_START=29 /DNA_END=766 /DNA_ORIENTATION=-